MAMKKRFVALAAVLALQGAWAAGEAPAPKASALQGKVLEVKDVDAYTYLRLKTADGETWAAVNRSPVKAGAEVTIAKPMVMRNFESKSLGRSFDVIVFGVLAGSPGATAASAPPAGGADLGAIHGSRASAPAVAVAKVEKAEGANGRTVAEIHAQRASLKDKPVTIRASVVKVTANVMGRNWIHLRDGSGSAGDGSDDLLVTSKERPKVGDVVVASGVVRTDVKLGSGYAYEVLVEGASFAK